MAVFNEDEDEVVVSTTETTTTETTVTTEPVSGADTPAIGDNVTEEEADVAHRDYITQDNMQTSMLFDKEVPVENIMNYISGMKWQVNYFLQLLDVQDKPNRPDINLVQTVQRYHQIFKMDLTLRTPLEQGNINDIEGEAVINAGILPNKYDAFVTTVAGGRDAIFTVEDVIKGHYNLREVYIIKFKLFYLIDNNTLLYNNMLSKVTHEYVYDSEHVIDRTAPVKVKKEYLEKLSYKEKVPELIDYYLKNFINKEKNVISIPTTDPVIYLDTLLTDFFFKLVNASDHLLVNKVTRIDTSLHEEIPYSVWDMIIKRDFNLRNVVTKDIGIVYTSSPVNNPTTRFIGYLGINYIVKQLEPGIDPIVPNYSEFNTFEELTDELKPVKTKDNNYVFSEYFYNDDPVNCGLLERAIIKYCKNERVVDTDLDNLLNTYHKWSVIEQFYFIPILIVLVRDRISRIYKTV